MKQVNQIEFDELIQGSEPVVVDFFATWCGPCKIMAPILDQVEQTETGQKFNFVKVDVDQNPELSNRYDVMAVPTLAIFKDGKVQYKQAGVHQQQQLLQVLEEHA